jgi:hypothetical protein
MYPLTTTTARIDACNPCEDRRQRAAKLLNIAEPSDEPITYAQLLDVLGLDDALWCCRAEPDLEAIWRRYAVWCARQVQHLMTDQRSLDALDVAERHANGEATVEELAAARDAAREAAADASDVAERETAWAAADAAARKTAWAVVDAADAAWAVVWAAWAAAYAADVAARDGWDVWGAARAAADAARAAASAARDAASAARDAARDARAARAAQVAAFRRLVTTGALD